MTHILTGKHFVEAGPEFGKDAGKPFIIVRALYGLKSSGASFRAHLAEYLEDELGFVSSLADPDVWRRICAKPDGEFYYEYILCYVDDILVCSHDPDFTMKQIQEEFDFKGNTWNDIDVYLGAKITKKVHNGYKL